MPSSLPISSTEAPKYGIWHDAPQNLAFFGASTFLFSGAKTPGLDAPLYLHPHEHERGASFLRAVFEGAMARKRKNKSSPKKKPASSTPGRRLRRGEHDEKLDVTQDVTYDGAADVAAPGAGYESDAVEGYGAETMEDDEFRDAHDGDVDARVMIDDDAPKDEVEA